MKAVTSVVHTTDKRRRAGIALMGPALVAAAAYVDPGNVATNTTAGSTYGYLLVWVIVAANLMAGLVQYLSAKLGLVTGMSLPEVMRERLPRRWRLAYWAQAELVTMATDLAEILGGAIALALLFDLPLVWGGLITTVVSMAVLQVQSIGQARFERVITAMLGIVAVGFLASLVVSPPEAGGVVRGLVPAFDGTGSVLLAAGMLGATVMPHAIYAHSALAYERHGQPTPGPERRRLLAATRLDVIVALTIAGTVNLGLLLLGAAVMPGDERTGTLDGLFGVMNEEVGSAFATLFAIALLFSGLASTAVGCYSGSVVMAGLLRVRIPQLVRRLITAVPALVVLAANIDPTQALVISQVVLSFGIPFALVPLVGATSNRAVMGADVNSRLTSAIAWCTAAAIVILNAALIVLIFFE